MRKTPISTLASGAALLGASLLMLQSCAALRPGYEVPTVTLESFQALPSDAGLPEFEIGLGIINPNPEPLDVAGVSYTISVAGHELVKGVGKGFEPIEGYAKGSISLIAGANLLAGIRLVTELLTRSPESLDYEFRAKLDLGTFRAIRISDTGEFSMRQEAATP